MTAIAAFAHGFMLALGLIAALGPQNVFVFQQGAIQPRLGRALPTITTAGLCDTGLVLLAVSGVSVVVFRFPWVELVLFGAGFVFLVCIGWRILTASTLTVDPHAEQYLGTRGQVGFTASVSLLNPHAILDTVGVIGTNALAYAGSGRWLFTAGCLLTSWLWFIGLAVAGWRLGDASNAERWMAYANVGAALVVWGVGAYFAWQLLGALGALL